jgi:hypothetical protein
MYKDSCMKYLQFLDYPSIQAESKSVEARLNAKIKELEAEIRQRDKEADKHTSSNAVLYEQILKLTNAVQKAGIKIE